MDGKLVVGVDNLLNKDGKEPFRNDDSFFARQKSKSKRNSQGESRIVPGSQASYASVDQESDRQIKEVTLKIDQEYSDHPHES